MAEKISAPWLVSGCSCTFLQPIVTLLAGPASVNGLQILIVNVAVDNKPTARLRVTNVQNHSGLFQLLHHFKHRRLIIMKIYIVRIAQWPSGQTE